MRSSATLDVLYPNRVSRPAFLPAQPTRKKTCSRPTFHPQQSRFDESVHNVVHVVVPVRGGSKQNVEPLSSPQSVRGPPCGSVLPSWVIRMPNELPSCDASRIVLFVARGSKANTFTG